MQTNDIDDLQNALNAYKRFEDMAHEIAQECSALFVNYKACVHERVIDKDEQEYITLQSTKTAIDAVVWLFHNQEEKLTAKIDGIKSSNKIKVKKFEIGKAYHTTGNVRDFVVTARYSDKDNLYIVIDNGRVFKIVAIVDGVEVAACNEEAFRLAADDDMGTAYRAYINV